MISSCVLFGVFFDNSVGCSGFATGRSNRPLWQIVCRKPPDEENALSGSGGEKVEAFCNKLGPPVPPGDVAKSVEFVIRPLMSGRVDPNEQGE